MKEHLQESKTENNGHRPLETFLHLKIPQHNRWEDCARKISDDRCNRDEESNVDIDCIRRAFASSMRIPASGEWTTEGENRDDANKAIQNANSNQGINRVSDGFYLGNS